jgi:hypothetical protein
MGLRREAQALERELGPEDVLTAELTHARAALASPDARELVDELLELAEPGSDPATWLVAPGSSDLERRQLLGDVLGSVARGLAHTGDAPVEGASARAWQALTTALDRLFGSGVRQLGRLPFVTEALLDALRDEARRQLPEDRGAGRAAPGAAGRALASLAVSPKLRQAVATAFDQPVTPSYDAVYLFDPPGSHVRTHVDTRDYELVVHLILEHALPQDGSAGSALVVHLVGESGPIRLPVQRGEAVALKGRGTIHSWEPLRDDERRTMTAIGFVSGP